MLRGHSHSWWSLEDHLGFWGLKHARQVLLPSLLSLRPPFSIFDGLGYCFLIKLYQSLLVLYLSWVRSLYLVGNILSLSVGSSFLVLLSFAVQKPLLASLCSPSWPWALSHWRCLGFNVTKGSASVFLDIIMSSDLVLRFLIHFESTFAHGVRKGPEFVF